MSFLGGSDLLRSILLFKTESVLLRGLNRSVVLIFFVFSLPLSNSFLPPNVLFLEHSLSKDRGGVLGDLYL